MIAAAPADLYFPGITTEHLDRRAVRRAHNLPRTARGFDLYSTSGHRGRQMLKRRIRRQTGLTSIRGL